MASGERHEFSSSNNGEPIQVSATGTPGTPIHTAAAKDEVHLYACNISAARVELTIEFGTTGAGKEIKITLEPKWGNVPVILGATLTAGAIAAYASVTNVVNVTGHVNRITN